MLKIHILSKYHSSGPSSRYRFFQFIPSLEKDALKVSVAPFFDKKYINNLFSQKIKLSFNEVAKAYFKRFETLLLNQNYDLLWIEKEALPWIPAFLENSLYKSSIPYVLDFDDAVFHRYDQHPNPLVKGFLSNKISKIMSRSSVVVAGNRYIADYAHKAGTKKVKIIPTVVDLSKYTVKETFDSRSFKIGWVGSPSTSRHISIAARALKDFCRNNDIEFTAIGAVQKDINKIPGKLIPWNAETETEELTRFDVGIMPLPDTPWEKGKCGFKIIQYMAAGLPVIASPVGVNSEIVDHGISGFLASSTKEWVKYLGILKGDPELRRTMGVAGRRIVEKKYSLEIVSPKLVSILKEAVKA